MNASNKPKNRATTRFTPLMSAKICNKLDPEIAFFSSEPIIEPPKIFPNKRRDKETKLAIFPRASSGNDKIAANMFSMARKKAPGRAPIENPFGKTVNVILQ